MGGRRVAEHWRHWARVVARRAPAEGESGMDEAGEARPQAVGAGGPPGPDPVVLARFAAWLGDLVRRSGFSQRALARQVRVSQATIYRWLHGIDLPHPRHVRVLAEALGQAPEAVARIAGYQPTLIGLHPPPTGPGPTTAVHVPVLTAVPSLLPNDWHRHAAGYECYIPPRRLAAGEELGFLALRLDTAVADLSLLAGDLLILDLGAIQTADRLAALLAVGQPPLVGRLRRDGADGWALALAADRLLALPASATLGIVVQSRRQHEP